MLEPITDQHKLFHQLIGGIRVADKIREAIGSQTMNALAQVQEQQLYKLEGFATFADFLNESPHSPMDKNKYYELKKVFDLEGDREFDLLNSINTPVSKRKLLSAGDVTIDGDQVIVGDQPYQISDKKGIKKALARLIEHVKIKEAEALKSEKEIAKKEKQIAELHAAPPSQLPADEASLVTQGITKIAAGFSDLIAGIRELNAEDFKTFKKKHARRIDSIVENYGDFLTTHKPTARVTEVLKDEDEYSDEELQGFLED